MLTLNLTLTVTLILRIAIGANEMGLCKIKKVNVNRTQSTESSHSSVTLGFSAHLRLLALSRQ